MPFKMVGIGEQRDTDDIFLGVGLADALVSRLSSVPLADKKMLVDWGFLITKLAIAKYMDVRFPQSTPFGTLN